MSPGPTAALVGTASIFSRRGLERESFDVLLVAAPAVLAKRDEPLAEIDRTA